MRANHGAVQYEIPNEWWEEAGMTGFAPVDRSFRSAAPERTRLHLTDVIEVSIADVAPVDRQLSHGVFADSKESGTARQRVVRILKGFRENAPIPPVEVVCTPDAPYRFRLYAGAHRFCCAVVAGFQAVPAVDVTKPQVEDVDFDRWMQARDEVPRR